jgi:hypothetical protein
MIKVNIFIPCHNEQVLLPLTINHYRKMFSDCNITIYDNYSNDKSVEIAKSMGCYVIDWDTKNEFNEFTLIDMRSNCWKNVKEGWVLTPDMDEWLCINEEELIEEEQKGTTIINTKGYNMFGNSKKETLEDINLNSVEIGYYWDLYDKKICFKIPDVKEMNYELGSHGVKPIGNITFSKKYYILKHFELVGLPFYKKKKIDRYNRSETMRKMGHCHHYINNEELIENNYNEVIKKCNNIYFLHEIYNS